MGFSSSRESTWDSDPTRALATITGLAERMDLHVNKLTDAVNSLSSATSINFSIKIDRTSVLVKTQNILIIQKLRKSTKSYEDDRTLYQEQKEITEKAFLESPSKNDPIFSAAIKDFLTLTM